MLQPQRGTPKLIKFVRNAASSRARLRIRKDADIVIGPVVGWKETPLSGKMGVMKVPDDGESSWRCSGHDENTHHLRLCLLHVVQEEYNGWVSRSRRVATPMVDSD